MEEDDVPTDGSAKKDRPARDWSVMGVVAEGAGDAVDAPGDMASAGGDLVGAVGEHAGGCAAEGCAGCLPLLILAILPIGWIAARLVA